MIVASILLGILHLISRAQGLEVWNTFEDSKMTGGVEGIFQYVGPTFISDEVEIPLFPKFFPPMKGDPNDGMYDIDVTRTSITFTLIDGSGGTDIVIPEGRFDRYYFNLDFAVAEATLTSSDTINASIEVVAPGALTDPPIDIFDSKISAPTFFHGGIIVSIEAGTDLSVNGQTIEIEYSLFKQGTDPVAQGDFLMMTARDLLKDTATMIQAGLPLEQKECGIKSSVDRYVFCGTRPDKPDDTTYIFHPQLPTGTKLSDLQNFGVDMYINVKQIVLNNYEILDGCEDQLDIKLGSYDWVNHDGKRVSRTTMLMDFYASPIPYLELDKGGRKLKKSKSKSKSKSRPNIMVKDDSDNMRNVERMFCGFNYISEVDAISPEIK